MIGRPRIEQPTSWKILCTPIISGTIPLYWHRSLQLMHRPPHAWRTKFLVLLTLMLPAFAAAQTHELRGTVTDAATGETLVGASVKLKDGAAGTVTDIDGRFKLRVEGLPPFTLSVAYMGYAQQDIVVQAVDQEIKAELGADQVLLQEAQVIAQRISDKQKQAPLTVE